MHRFFRLTLVAPARRARAALLGMLLLGVLLASVPATPPPVAAQGALTAPATLTFPVVADSFVRSQSPGSNYGAATILEVVYNTGLREGSFESRALLRFDLGRLPASAIVVSATLELYLERSSGASSSVIAPEAALASWDEAQVTWESRPGSQSRGDSPASVDNQAGWKLIDVTKIAQSWQARAMRNHGIVLRAPSGDINVARFFAAREQPAFAPRLRVAYLDAQTPGLSPAEAPAALYRRAAQLLEEMRGSPLAPGWETATIGPNVYPIYRPDITGPAYYEFQVFTPPATARVAATLATDPPLPAGFIIVANGEHDYPIPHWSFIGASPVQQMQQQAQLAGAVATKFYKLDALAYAAEDAQGDQVATFGAPLVKVSGMDPAWLDAPREIAETSWTPNTTTPDSEDGSAIAGTVQASGPPPPAGLTLSAWESWDALKAGYADAYDVLAEALRRDAAVEWAVEQQVTQTGEILQKGDIYPLALLAETTPQITLTGAGAALVSGRLLSRAGLPPAYEITVLEAPQNGWAPLDVQIAYPNRTETVKFLIANLNFYRHQVYVPLLLMGTRASGQTAPLSNLSSSWSKWNYFFAGTEQDQSAYSQIAAGDPPNTSGCVSGCGATAWSMLLSWVDRQAAKPGSYWSDRWGIYRQNGGKGADAVAPFDMTSGVRSMMWEIRNGIGTFCAFGNGATAPWDMGGAYQYLQGRSAAFLTTSYDSFGFTQGDLRDRARRSIQQYNTPAVIGTGWLSHYPLAFGYSFRSRVVQKCFFGCWQETEYQRRFLVNQGWAGSSDNIAWAPADTWFAGRIWPCYFKALLGPNAPCLPNEP